MERDFEKELKQVRRVAPPEDLFAKIESRLQEKSVPKVSTPWMVAACAALLLLAVTNIVVLSGEAKQDPERGELQVVASALYSNNNQLYYE